MSNDKGFRTCTLLHNRLGEFPVLKQGIYRLLLHFLTRFRVLKIPNFRALKVSYAESDRISTLPKFSGPQEWFFSEANALGREVISVSGFGPSVGYTYLQDAVVVANPRHSGVIHNGLYLLDQNGSFSAPRITVSDPPVAGHLYYFNSNLLIKATEPVTLGKGIYVGSRSPHNWYHWIIDTLPAVYLSRFLPSELSEVPLLIPLEATRRPDWMEMLDVVNPSREIVPFAQAKYVAVKELTWVHPPTVRREPVPGENTPLFAMESSSMLAYRQHVLDHFAPKFSGECDRTRIFLARDQSGLRPYNQEEILRIAGEFGFSPLYLESMALSESMEMLAKAEYIIGPHGAAWASALFATSARAALIWTWDQARIENWFHNVLGLQGIRYQTLFTGTGNNSSPYTLSTHTFREALRSLLNNPPAGEGSTD